MDRCWALFYPLDGEWYRWRLNGGLVHLCRQGKIWRYAAGAKTREELDAVCDGPLAGFPPIGLEQAIAIGNGDSVALRPTMVNKPVVITALNPLQIMGNQEVRLVVDLPVSVHLELADGDTLCRLNTFHLPRTWFGDTNSGTLCFSWPVHIEPETDEGHISPGAHRSMLRCRIIIRNLSRNSLELKQCAIYTEMLDIWDVGGQLKTDTVLMEGLSDGTLRMSTIPDPEAHQGTRLYHSDIGHTELLIKRGVSFLRSVTGIS